LLQPAAGRHRARSLEDVDTDDRSSAARIRYLFRLTRAGGASCADPSAICGRRIAAGRRSTPVAAARWILPAATLESVVIARSEATKQSRSRQASCVPLDRVATARPEGRASLDVLWLAMTAKLPSKWVDFADLPQGPERMRSVSKDAPASAHFCDWIHPSRPLRGASRREVRGRHRSVQPQQALTCQRPLLDDRHTRMDRPC
jgi:hypothetical protein